MNDITIFAVSLGIVIGLGLYNKKRKTDGLKAMEAKLKAKSTSPQRLRNPNIRRVK